MTVKPKRTLFVVLALFWAGSAAASETKPGTQFNGVSQECQDLHDRLTSLLKSAVDPYTGSGVGRKEMATIIRKAADLKELSEYLECIQVTDD
ncbi:hypothetical protein PsAD2_01162 [Pseudovibrio axinellae]|uniref:Uncharacterized protein n=1 Tax=Pseudovibrio axinellae TaxID=989403 RepID=A0A166A6L6_9HYPH|nr:hypothetical protein [Pseudovibrio axinellae]KZL20675.1 hypothetical protein PsAD2_01162 [Pseudovibrio axinellae]SER26067.1 hypothetical protein SAMN05421798_107215 [Pseudovibrio axinellae]